MKIKITKGGIFGADKELAIGTIVEVSKAPAGWAGRYEVIEEKPKAAKVAVTNPDKSGKKAD